jgi:hypothetical protein
LRLLIQRADANRTQALELFYSSTVVVRVFGRMKGHAGRVNDTTRSAVIADRVDFSRR